MQPLLQLKGIEKVVSRRESAEWRFAGCLSGARDGAGG